MDHELSEAQAALRSTTAMFFSHDYPLERMRDVHRSPDRFDVNLWGQMCRLGWASAALGDESDGLPGSFLDAAVILEQLGRAAAVSPYVHSAVAAGLALQACHPAISEEIAVGSAVVVPVSAPPSNKPGLKLEPNSEDRVFVSGSVVGARWQPLATHFLLRVTDVWVLIDTASARLQSKRLDTAIDEPTSELSLDRVEGLLIRPASPTVDPLLLGAAGQAIALAGMSARALELAVAYAKERIQFGRPIGAFQAIQHRCADMHIASLAATELGYKAAWTHGEAPECFERNARYAKAFSGDAAAFITRQAIQVHGGVGFVDGHKVQLFYLGALAASAVYGTPMEHRAAISSQLLERRN